MEEIKSKKLNLFIIGFPRSGTKLLRNILNSHSSIFIPDVETLFIPRLLKKYKCKVLQEQDLKDIINDIRNSLFYFYYFENAGYDFNKISNNSKTIIDFFDHFFYDLSRVSKKSVKILGDKSPKNIFNINTLVNYYPNVKYIHIIRDPRDVVLSSKNIWNKNIYRSAVKWETGVRNFNSIVNSIDCIEIKYEELVKHPQEVMKKVTHFLEIPFEKEMLDINSSVENYGDAKGVKGILKGNINKFLVKLSQHQINKIERYAYSMHKYGYAFSSDSITPSTPLPIQMLVWKLKDQLNLLRFNIKEHGFSRGISKTIKAYKERVK